MKRIWILGLCLLMAAGLQAQTTYSSSGKAKYNNKKKKKNEEGFAQRIIWGGALGLSLGDYAGVSVTPVIGYRITDNFSAGIGLGYQFLRVKDFFEVTDRNNNLSYYDFKASMYSASIWARYIVWRNLFIHAEYEHNFMNFKQPGFDPGGSGEITLQSTNYQAPSVLIGPGYRLPIGEKASVNFSLLYDVIQDEYSPYGNQPFIRLQFLAGF